MALIEEQKQLEHLKSRLDSFQSWTKKHHKRSSRINKVLVFLGLLSSTFVGYFGLTGEAKIAGILGLVTTLLISMQNAFKFNEKAIVYLNMHNESKNLRDELYYEPDGDPHVIEISNKFIQLKRQGLGSLPKDANLEQLVNSDK